MISLLKNSLSSRQSCSFLLVGPQFCGKSTLLRSVLSGGLGEEVASVWLRGSFFRDDSSALAELERPIMAADQEEFHFDSDFDRFKRHLSASASFLVVVLEEFEQFCIRPQKQSFLYSLFSCVHENSAPLIVVGESARQNCLELLEKRVKSRFSNRVFRLESFASVDSFKAEILPTGHGDPAIDHLVSDEFRCDRSVERAKNLIFESEFMGQQVIQNRSSPENDWLWKILSELSDFELAFVLVAKRMKETRRKLTFESIYGELRFRLMVSEGTAPSRDFFLSCFEGVLFYGIFKFSQFGNQWKRHKLAKDFRRLDFTIPILLFTATIERFGKSSIPRAISKILY